jgi:hypothetical protein
MRRLRNTGFHYIYCSYGRFKASKYNENFCKYNLAILTTKYQKHVHCSTEPDLQLCKMMHFFFSHDNTAFEYVCLMGHSYEKVYEFMTIDGSFGPN